MRQGFPKYDLLVVVLLLAIAALLDYCTGLPPKKYTPPTPRPPSVRTTYTVFLPMMVFTPWRKGLASDKEMDGGDLMGVGGYYEWNHLCEEYLMATYSQECFNFPRSDATTVFKVYGNCGTHSQDELRACITAQAARYPGTRWLVGNEPDGPDPAYSDNMTPSVAADHYGQIVAAIRAGNPSARIYCCGFVLPMHLTTYATDFNAAWLARWGTPFSEVGGFAFHIYSAVGSTCSYSDTPCLQSSFDTQLSAGIQWARSNGFSRISVSEFNWTPAPAAQIIAINAERIPGMCRSLKTSGIDHYFLYHDPYPSPFALLNGDGTLNVAGEAYRDC